MKALVKCAVLLKNQDWYMRLVKMEGANLSEILSTAEASLRVELKDDPDLIAVCAYDHANIVDEGKVITVDSTINVNYGGGRMIKNWVDD